MKVKFVISDEFLDIAAKVRGLMDHFTQLGTVLASGRNTIRIFDLDQHRINIKSFKRPNIINRFVYKYFRKSKAQRSFEYATRLLEMGVGTPKPVAFCEHIDLSGLRASFYASEHLDAQLT
ncbi:MAG: Kdo domain containing protein, partial [Chitinophagaceae bacterium]